MLHDAPLLDKHEADSIQSYKNVLLLSAKDKQMVGVRPNRPGQRSAGPWETVRLFNKSFSEQQTCMRTVYAIAQKVVFPPSGTGETFGVHVGPIPDAFFTPRKNIFSTLFYAVYLTLNIPQPRRMLYGALNHLFRIWVTSADNLLDDEDKCVLPLVMPRSSRVMREVISIMAADRILWHLLRTAISAKTLSANQADELAEQSLSCLLPSAAQEASEEGGITNRPSPEYVLDTIHMFKTGMLFNIPFLGIDIVEKELDPEHVNRLKRALMLFGGGCQLLDDVRDVGRDFTERRHNYVLSVLARDQPEQLRMWSRQDIKPSDRLYREILPICLPALRLGFKKIIEACHALQAEGLLPRRAPIHQMALSMVTALDLEELSYACTAL